MTIRSSKPSDFQPIDWRDLLTERAVRLHDQAIVVDMCLPWTAENVSAREGVLEGYAAAGGTVTSLSSAFGNFSSFETTVRHISADRRRIANSSGKVMLIETADDIERVKREKKLGAYFNLQGCDPLNGDLNMVETYYRLGVRQMLFCYNTKNVAGDGCHERTDAGLSRFGVDLIQEMNRVGMIIDCTHTGYRTTMDMMEYSTDPVIFSHSNVRALFDHPRNILDEQIMRCAETGGLVGVNGFGPFLGNDASVENVVRHIDHIVQLVGPKHAGLGFDAVYTPQITYRRILGNREAYPGYPEPPWEFLLPHRAPEITEGLVRLGYDDDAILGILGGNFLRVARAVWRPI